MYKPYKADPPISFTGSGLDRADHIRADTDKLAELTNWRARLLRLDGLDPVIGDDGTLSWGSLADADATDELVFLGLDDAGRACFAAVSPTLMGNPGPANPRLWAAMSALPASDLATYGSARALVDWHARHRFCARCGYTTKLGKGGWQRKCTKMDCKAEHFPRVDPVTIMSVEWEGQLLLGRQPRFPARRYSALAGFVEPGESIEEAVAREVFEEAGVRVRDVQYVACQPWPFPSSLMIGCHAYADAGEITIDKTELDDARWFTREEVVYAMEGLKTGREDGAFIAPPPFAVAHHLLKWWIEQ
jgi:NAD+ diphosphatase